jgi:hypothetical protein
VASLAVTSQVSQTYRLDPKSGVSYPILAQTPENHIDTLDRLENIPVTGFTGGLQIRGGSWRDQARHRWWQLGNVRTQGTMSLFAVADDSKVPIYVNVPQNYSARVHPGLRATFTVPDYPAQSFAATLMANAQSVNTQSGTVLMQLLSDNPDCKPSAGAYAQVSFDLPASANTIQLPAQCAHLQRERHVGRDVGTGTTASP